MITAYRRRVGELVTRLLRPLAPLQSALDFVAGDGWCAQKLEREGLVDRVTAVDVRRRADTVRPVEVYGGEGLPFADGAFDLALAIDVLHHCDDPASSLEDLARCTGRF